MNMLAPKFIPPIIIGLVSGGADAGTRLIEGQPMGLATAVTVAAAVAGFGIWLEHRLSRIETRLDDLPCQNNGCALKKKRKK